MGWRIEYYSQNVQDWVGKMPIGIRAAYAKLAGLLTEFGMDLRLPHSRAMGDGVFELRPKGKEGITRVFYPYFLAGLRPRPLGRKERLLRTK